MKFLKHLNQCSERKCKRILSKHLYSQEEMLTNQLLEFTEIIRLMLGRIQFIRKIIHYGRIRSI